MNYNEIVEPEFKMYRSRFLVVGLFTLVQMMTSILLNTLTPIASLLTVVYGYGPVIINLGGLLFALMHPIFTFPAAYVIDTYGTKNGIFLGSVLGIIGVTMRLFVNSSFAFVIVGQVIAGIGRPFILNCQAKISANWFTAEKRGGITQILTLVINVSLILGMLIPGLVFNGYRPKQDDDTSIEQGKQLTFNLMLIQAILGYICFVPNLIFQKSKPPTAPSDSADIKRDPFNVAIPSMLKNKNYMFLLLAFGCFFGIFNGISIILSFLLKPWFGAKDLPLAVTAVGGSPIISGILGVTILGPMQRKSKQFKKWILICMAGSTLAIGLFYPFLEFDNLFLACFISMFNSFFLIPLVPIMLELGCELVFPVGEGSAVGLLFACGNFCGFLFGFILNQIVKGQDKGQSGAGLGFCFGIFLIGALLTILMKQQKRRQKAESQASERRRSTISQNSDNLSAKQEINQIISEYKPPNLNIDEYKL